MKSDKQRLRVSIVADTNWEAKIDHVLKVLELRRSFEVRNHHYGNSLSAIVIVLMCRDPSLAFTQRVRFQKSTRAFSMDIMLNLPEVVTMTHAQRRELIAGSLIEQVPERLQRYRFEDFDYSCFEEHWRQDITQQLLGPDASRFDHLCLAQASHIIS